MKTLADIKAAYPAYKDVPDLDLGRALHAKFYADRLPWEDFSARMGLPVETESITPTTPPQGAETPISTPAKLAAPVAAAPATDGQPVGPVVPAMPDQGLWGADAPGRPTMSLEQAAMEERRAKEREVMGGAGPEPPAMQNLRSLRALGLSRTVDGAEVVPGPTTQSMVQVGGVVPGQVGESLNPAEFLAFGAGPVVAQAGRLGARALGKMATRTTAEQAAALAGGMVGEEAGGPAGGMAGMFAGPAAAKLSKWALTTFRQNTGLGSALRDVATNLGAQGYSEEQAAGVVSDALKGAVDDLVASGMTRGKAIRTLRRNPEAFQSRVVDATAKPAEPGAPLGGLAPGATSPRPQEPAPAPGATISPEPMPTPAPAPESPAAAGTLARPSGSVSPWPPATAAPREMATLESLRLEMAAKDAALEDSTAGVMVGEPYGPPPPSRPARPALRLVQPGEPSQTPGGATGPQEGLAQPGPASMGGDSSSPARPAGVPSMVKGEGTRIFAVGRDEPYEAQYAVMELADLRTSHMPDTFAKNPAYPDGVQERDYLGDKLEQMKVIDHANKLEPAFLVTNDPTAINGPTIVTPDGIALSGNSRGMRLGRAYAGGKDQAQAYRSALERHAGFFGLDPKQVAGMRQPVLVRVVDPPDYEPKTLHRMASEFNQAPTQELGQDARIASAGANVSPDTLNWLSESMNYLSSGSLREFLDTSKWGIKALNRLVQDGVVPQTKIPRYWNEKRKKLSSEGKTLVEETVLGSLVPDLETLRYAPDSVKNKVGAAIPALAKLRGNEAADLSGDISPALRIIMEADARDVKNTRDWGMSFAQQQEMEPRTEFYTPRQVALAIALKDMGPNQFREAVKGYAADVAPNMFTPGMDPGQAFAKHFGAPPAWASRLGPQGQEPQPTAAAGGGQGGFGFADTGGYADIPPGPQRAPAIKVSTQEKPLLWPSIWSFAKRTLFGKLFKNNATAWEIHVNRHSIGHANTEAEKSLVFRIPEMLREASYLRQEPVRSMQAKGVKAVHRFLVDVEIDGQPTKISLLVRETQQGKYLYDHSEWAEKAGRPAGASRSMPPDGDSVSRAYSEPPSPNMGGKEAKVKPQGGQADRGGYGETPPPGGSGPSPGGAAGPGDVSPLEGPEVLQLAEGILGKTPKVRRVLRKQGAQGVFYPGDGRIELAAKIFEKPEDAVKTLAHEVGHAIDWLPDKDLRRGNLLGRIASLKKNTATLIPGEPGGPGPLTPADEARLRAEAEAMLRQGPQVVEKEIDEEITRTLAITSQEVLAIFNDVTGQIKQTAPDLYRYVAGLNTAEKKAIVKEALKGQVRADLQQFAQTITEKTGRKIKTTETVAGKAPLKKDIEKKFRELVQEEIKKRALLRNKIVRDELKALSQMWKPFNPAVNDAYTKYRHSGVELYADALSVLINRPDLVQQMAPEFYRGFFAYLGEKPAVKATWDDIQARLRDPERVMEARQAREEAGFAVSEAKRRQALEADNKGVIRNWLAKSFVDTFGNAYSLSAKATGLRSGDTPLVRAHEQARLASSEVEAYYRKVYQEVLDPIQKVAPDLNKTYSIMLLRRVIGERHSIANPGNESTKPSTDRLAWLRRKLGDEAYNTIIDRLKHFNALRQERVIDVAEKAGIWSPTLLAKAQSNDAYARFEVVDYMLAHQGLGPASGRVYSQLGTLKQVGNPLVATMLGDAGIISAARWAMATKELIKTLGRHFPDEIKPARRGQGGMFQEPRDRAAWGLVRYLDRGKPVAFEVTKSYAEMYKRNPVMVDKAVRLLNEFSSIPRSLYTGRNPLFWVFNLIKDFRDNLINLPGGPLEVWKLAPKYIQGVRHAYRAAANKPDPLYDYLLRNHYLMPAHAAGSPGDDASLDAITRELTRRGVMRPASSVKNPILRPLAMVWDFLGAVGEAQSRTSKVAAHLYLKEHFGNLPEETRAYIVRNFAADPPYYRKGDWTPVTNSIWLFSNPQIQGFRRGIQAAFFSAEQAKAAGKKPWMSDFALKFILYGLVPKLLMWAAKYGAFTALLVSMAQGEEEEARARAVGERLQKAMWGASKYNLVNYDIVPVPVPGKDGLDFTLLRIPKDHLSQFAGGLVWNILDAASGDPRFKTPDVLSYAAGQGPALNPAISIPRDLWKVYIDKVNPLDDFRGRPIVPEKAFEAGGLRLHKEVGRYIVNELSPVKLASGHQVEKGAKTALDQAKEIPGIGPFVAKFMIDQEQGWREVYRAATEPTRAAQAGRQMDLGERIVALVNEHGGKVPRAAVAQLRRDAAAEGLLDLKTTSVGDLLHRVNRTASRAGDDRRLEALHAAPNNEAKAVLLKRFENELSADDYSALVRTARREKAISKGTMGKLRQAGGDK